MTITGLVIIFILFISGGMVFLDMVERVRLVRDEDGSWKVSINENVGFVSFFRGINSEQRKSMFFGLLSLPIAVLLILGLSYGSSFVLKETFTFLALSAEAAPYVNPVISLTINPYECMIMVLTLISALAMLEQIIKRLKGVIN